MDVKHAENTCLEKVRREFTLERSVCEVQLLNFGSNQELLINGACQRVVTHEQTMQLWQIREEINGPGQSVVVKRNLDQVRHRGHGSWEGTTEKVVAQSQILQPRPITKPVW